MGGSSHTETSNTVDPKLMALYQQNYNMASQVADRPFQPYTGERVAGFNDNQMAGFNAFFSAANNPTALNAISRAQDATGSLLSYQAPVIGSPGDLTARSVSARSIAAPMVSPAPTVNAVGVNAGLLSGTDLTPYLNPYTDDVVNAALGDLYHSRQQQGVADNASATAAHAFGGTRQAVLDANTTDDYLRNVASTSASLRQGAYQSAQQAALQDIQNQLNAGEFNSSQAYDAQKFNATNSYDLAKTNAGYQFGADQFNANAAAAADQYNANAATAAEQYNLGSRLDIARANAANSLAGAGLQLNAANQYAGFGQDYFNQLAQQGQLYSQVGTQQQALQQAQDDAAYDEFMRQLNYPYQQQQLRNQAVGMMPMQQTQTTTQSKSPGVLDMFNTASQFINPFTVPL
jgi:hypothetical protein